MASMAAGVVRCWCLFISAPHCFVTLDTSQLPLHLSFLICKMRLSDSDLQVPLLAHLVSTSSSKKLVLLAMGVTGSLN